MKINCKYEKLIPIDAVIEHDKNPNTHPKRQIEMLAKMMKYQGWRHPIIISKLSGKCVAGHGRKYAAKLNGWTEVPVDMQDFDDMAQEISFLAGDNLIKDLSETDQTMLEELVVTLGEEFDHELLGLEEQMIIDDPDKEAIEDDVPVVDESRTISKLGDLYELGEHRLMCGDSTDKATVERLMNGDKADMVFTDPPYELITKGGGLLKESKAMREISELGIDKFNPESLSLHAETNIFCCNKPLIKKYIELAETHKVSWDLAIYHKQNITANYGGHLMTDIEYLLVIGKQAPRTGLGEDKSLYSKLYSGGKDQDNVTAWSKPVALCEKFIKLYSTKSVMDYFGGSGSTLIACEKTKRKCFMMELDPHYIDVIVSRWCKYTGKTKIKRNGEEMDWITQ